MAGHTCHAFRCDTPCRPTMLMCPRHWRMVPHKLKQAVLETYTRGQCGDHTKVRRDWLAAARAAIDAVKKKERAA